MAQDLDFATRSTSAFLTGTMNGTQLSKGKERCQIAEPMWRSLLQTLLVGVGCCEVMGLLPGRVLLYPGRCPGLR